MNERSGAGRRSTSLPARFVSPAERARQPYRAVLAHDPRDGASLRALYHSYLRDFMRDEAWCVARVLVFVGQADRAVQRHFERGRRDGPIRPHRAMNDDLWLRWLRHEAQNLIVSKMLQQLWPAVLSLRGKLDRDAGLAPRFLIDPARSTITLARTFGFGAHLLAIPQPRLFVRRDVQGGLTHQPVYPLASLAGGTLLTGFDPRELLFVCGRHLSDLRGEHYARTLLPTPHELRMVLLGALRTIDRCPSHPRIDAIARELGAQLSPTQIAILVRLARMLFEDGEDVDMTTWLQAVELTACRAGFLLCDDLTTAARMVKALGSTGPVDLTPRQKIDELVRFAASESYFALRSALGITYRLG